MAIITLLQRPSEDVLEKYLERVTRNIQSGTATEESFYGAFAELLEGVFPSNQGFLVQTNPRDVHAESLNRDKPDFIVYFLSIPILRIEGKNPEDPIPDWVAVSSGNRLHNQVFRYRGGVGKNYPVGLSDFLKLWGVDQNELNSLSNDHILLSSVEILRPTRTGYEISPNASEDVFQLFQTVCASVITKVDNLTSLVGSLIQPAKEFEQKILEIIRSTDPESSAIGVMRTYFKRIQDDFNHAFFKEGTSDEEFAELIVETIVYGAFVAWMRYCREGNSSDTFQISNAGSFLPFGSFIQQMFSEINTHVSRDVRGRFLTPIERVLQHSEYPVIIEDFESLITSFYGVFLWKYDEETAKNRGVIYTPHEIVRYIIKGVDYLLKEKFFKENGVSSENIKFLDPASGTMSFPCVLMHEVHDKLSDEYASQLSRISSKFNQWFHDQFLQNVYAFEVLIAPYVLGHLRVKDTAQDLGATISEEDRIKLYLINTLMDDPETAQSVVTGREARRHSTPQATLLPYLNPQIEAEINQGLRVRNEASILIVMGNPPYNVSTQNGFDWINDKMRSYKEDLDDERNIQPLSDDYVKFIRFAQWKIERSRAGIIGFITNNTYLDSRIFRTMRKELCETFDLIYVVNLHGNARKGEQGNPFKIRVGVAIVFFIRLENHSDDEIVVKYKSVPQPTITGKFYELARGFLEEEFEDLPVTPQCYFVPIDDTMDEKFESFIQIGDLFIHNTSSGVKTHRDNFVVAVDRNVLQENIGLFFNGDLNALQERGIKIKENDDWNRQMVLDNTTRENVIDNIIYYQYRGFDRRYISFHRALLTRPRFDFMENIRDTENPTICVTKQLLIPPFNHAFITTNVYDICAVSTQSKESAYGFPILFEGDPNVNIPELAYEATEEEVFYYIYGILHSTTYKERYESQLVRDFPRIPFPDSRVSFQKMTDFGRKLAELHLLTSSDLNPTRFPMGSNTDYRIIRPLYNEENQRIYFDKPRRNRNEPAWIGGITQVMIDFEIGGKQSILEWLKARRYSQTLRKNTISRALNEDELDYFLKMCDAIAKTIELLPEIDQVYNEIDPE